MSEKLCRDCEHFHVSLNTEPCVDCTEKNNWVSKDAKYKIKEKKTLYIGISVEGRKYSGVMADIRMLHEVAENLFGEELEVLDSYRVGELRDRTNGDIARHHRHSIGADYKIIARANANKTGPIREPIVE